MERLLYGEVSYFFRLLVEENSQKNLEIVIELEKSYILIRDEFE